MRTLLVWSLNFISRHELLRLLSYWTGGVTFITQIILKRSLFLHNPEIYFIQQKTPQEILNAFPFFNKKATLTQKIFFCCNPASITIACLLCVKNIVISLLDSFSGASCQSNSLNKLLKRLLITATELLIIPLNTLQILFNIPCYLLLFIMVKIPDFFAWLFFDFQPQNPQNHYLVPESTSYIQQKLGKTSAHN